MSLNIRRYLPISKHIRLRLKKKKNKTLSLYHRNKLKIAFFIPWEIKDYTLWGHYFSNAMYYMSN